MGSASLASVEHADDDDRIAFHSVTDDEAVSAKANRRVAKAVSHLTRRIRKLPDHRELRPDSLRGAAGGLRRAISQPVELCEEIGARRAGEPDLQRFAAKRFSSSSSNLAIVSSSE